MLFSTLVVETGLNATLHGYTAFAELWIEKSACFYAQCRHYLQKRENILKRIRLVAEAALSISARRRLERYPLQVRPWAKNLSPYYPRLMLAVVLLSQHQVSSALVLHLVPDV